MTPTRARWLALPLAVLTGCATASASAPRLLPGDLHVGALDQRTAFELDEGVEPAPAADDDLHPKETPKKKRRRKGLFFLGLGAAGFGALGFIGFGVGGRVVQAQLVNGFEDGTLTRDRRNTLDSTGEVMNGLAIGTGVLGLAGTILAATMYGIDHTRCGDLPPRRKQCPDREAPADDSSK